MTPVFDTDGIVLYFGRCEDVLPTLDGPVDAIISDPPYAVTRNAWDQQIDPVVMWELYRPLMGERTPVVLFAGGPFAARLIVANEAAYKYDLVWDKQAVSGHLNAKRMPLRAHEQILVFYRRAPAYTSQMVYTGRSSHSRGERQSRTTNHWRTHINTPTVDQGGKQYPRSIISFKRPKGVIHPTQKPVELLEWLVRSYTNPGDLVLDNACGSATTLVAARNCGRRAIGVEAHFPYVCAALDRLHSGATGDHW